jgi:hypothetical protein
MTRAAPAPFSDLLHREELRALHQLHNQTDAPPDDRVHALHMLDQINARLADAPELAHLPVHPADHHCTVDTQLAYSLCHDCDGPIHRQRARRTYQIGQIHVCRRHALLRIRAGHQAGRQTNPSPPRPTDLNHWIDDEGIHLDPAALEQRLLDWRIDDDTRIGLLEHASDTKRDPAP